MRSAPWPASGPSSTPSASPSCARSVAAEFESHDNRTQFRAGVDLILAGIERRAEAGE